MKALVVDDSLVVRTIITSGIESMGFEAVHAGNGQEALDILSKQASEFQLVLLDWNMPVMNGYEAVQQIKANDACGHLCIVMISTESEDEKIDQALAAGANGYLAKPFSEEELAEKINKAMASFNS